MTRALTKKGVQALRAVWDCHAVAAKWQHRGFEELRRKGLVIASPVQWNNHLTLHKLNDAGLSLAVETFTVSGSLRVGGEQANNNAAPHNFTQRQFN